MSLSPWTVALLSTGYDLPDIRAALSAAIKELRFDLLAYENPEFPVAPKVHSHEACVLAIDQADIAVLVVDRRYGGMYLGTGDNSVTETEFQTAVRKGKIVIPCIRKNAWDERHNLFRAAQLLRKTKSRVNLQRELPPKYVESWKVLDFIERIRKADRDNFVIIYDTVVDLKAQLGGRLAGISHWLLLNLVREQMQAVRDIKTTTGLSFSLGDVLQKRYFVEPPFRILSGSTRARKVSEIGRNMRARKKCLGVIGEPGSGKTTILGEIYLDHAKETLKDNSTLVPFFLSLRGRGHYRFDFNEYLAEAFATVWQKEPYPQLDLSRIRPMFYFDGLDEMSEVRTDFDAAEFCSSSMFVAPFVMASRSRFAAEVLNDPAIGNRLSVIAELQPWDRGRAVKYVRGFCRIRHRMDLLPELRNLLDTEAMAEIGANPLLLTLLLCLVEETGMRVPLAIRDKQTLLARTLETWGRRELGRLRGNAGVTPDETKILLKTWRAAAWRVYCSRFVTSPPLRIDSLFGAAKGLFPETADMCNRECFAGLFDIRPGTDEVTGLIHEQLLEELVAELLSDAMKDNRHPFPESLGVAVRWEINQLIRSKWNELSESERSQILSHLVAAYWTALRGNAPTDIMRRNQAAYYMGRLDVSEAVGELRSADAQETNLFVKLSIAFGLIKRCQFDVEENFVTKLRGDPNWDSGNRGYHLFYYRDWQVRDIVPPYIDPGNIPWTNTMNALLRHIESSEVKHVTIRRIELIAIRRFMETRNRKGPLSTEIMKRIERAINLMVGITHPSVPADFLAKVNVEFVALKNAWAQVS